ncbi:uncharacterized protein TrAFT101_004484 [Trichoderma asperellum]|uniref:uncharacterized protein n=1 Tax=Trichoderma asperellum TaxID=101201 RepID=UPI00332589AB|nr:hypothetical protein TrAFT101_004484 [Trichoderma asperellum]
MDLWIKPRSGNSQGGIFRDDGNGQDTARFTGMLDLGLRHQAVAYARRRRVPVLTECESNR